MKKWLFIILILVGVGILAYALVRSTREEVLIPKNSTIIGFGDSLVAGYGATGGNDFISVLSKSIGKPVENFGVSGDTTADALARIDTVIAKDPGIVILLIGGNDILRNVPITETEKNIRIIIETFTKQKIIVVLVGVRGALLNDPYGPMYESIAHDNDLIYVPNILGGLIGNSIYMYDAIHPNDAGYMRVAKKIEDAMEPLLGR